MVQRNIGVVAHVDAGKTTLTEQMLHAAGAISSLGRVDDGTAHTDSMDIERQRGISVRSAARVLQWRAEWIGIIDTPGHVDFAADVERSLRLLDGAVLVVSAAEGVQAQTRVLWKALEAMAIPAIIFINKVDRVGANPARVLEDIRRHLTDRAAPIQSVVGAGQPQASVYPLLDQEPCFQKQAPLLEALAEYDAQSLECFVEETPLTPSALRPRLDEALGLGRMVPVLYGAALHGTGVTALLDGVLQCIPAPTADAEAAFSGLVVAVSHDRLHGRAALTRIFQGRIGIRDPVEIRRRQQQQKVSAVERLEPGGTKTRPQADAGQLAVFYGLGDVRVGDILGDPTPVPGLHSMAAPLLRVRVDPPDEARYIDTAEALQLLDAEDPGLSFEWWREERELYLRIMGPIQMEVLTAVLAERFQLEIQFGTPSVVYKETLAGPGEGSVSYTMPKPCWAKIRLLMEPLPQGSGLQYSSTVSYDVVPKRYQQQVEAALPGALSQGLFGWEVVDLKVTLVDGEYHVEHTKAPDFTVATPMAVMDGLQNSGIVLLEPIERVWIEGPEDMTSRFLGDITAMRGHYDTPQMVDGVVTIEAWVPAAELMDYAVRLASISSGRAQMSRVFHGYQPAPIEVQAEKKRRGVNPLDRSRYILWVRNALQ